MSQHRNATRAGTAYYLWPFSERPTPTPRLLGKHSSQRILCYVLFMYTHISQFTIWQMWVWKQQAKVIEQRRSILLDSPYTLATTLQLARVSGFEGFAPRIKVEELLTAQDWGSLESQLYLPKPYVKATLSHPTPTTDISYFTVSSGTEFFQKPLILIREGKPGAARMTCHFRANRNKNFLISNSMLSKQRNWGVQANPGKGTAALSGWHSAPGAEGG